MIDLMSIQNLIALEAIESAFGFGTQVEDRRSTIVLDSLEFLEIRLLGRYDPWTPSRLMPEVICHRGIPRSWNGFLNILPRSLKELRMVTYLPMNRPYSRTGTFKSLLESGSNGAAFFQRKDLKDLKVSFEERKMKHRG